MPLKEQLTTDLTDAMRAGDEVRKSTLRMLMSAVKNAEVPKILEHRVLDGETWESIAQKYGVEPERVIEANDVDPDELHSGERLHVVLPRELLDDSGVEALIASQIKQRRDSIDAFQKAGRQDLVDQETAEMVILQAYMPEQMGRDEITAEVRKVIEEVGAKGPADKGKVMQVLMPRLSGKAEGREINAVVTELLTG